MSLALSLRRSGVHFEVAPLRIVASAAPIPQDPTSVEVRSATLELKACQASVASRLNS